MHSTPGTRFLLKCDMEEGGAVELPAVCPSQGDRHCAGERFKPTDVQVYTSFQEIKVG